MRSGRSSSSCKTELSHFLQQRRSPRGHILKSLALASTPQVLKNYPVLGSRGAQFFKLLKFCRSLENFFEDLSFFWRTLAACILGPWPRAFLSLALIGSLPGMAVLGLGFFMCSWPRAVCPRLHLCFTV